VPKFVEHISLKLGLVGLGLIAVIEGIGVFLANDSINLTSEGELLLFGVGAAGFTLTALLPALTAVAGRDRRFLHLGGIGILGLVGVGWMLIFMLSSQYSVGLKQISATLAVAHFGTTWCLFAPKPEG
jgi:hypothetical protein